MCTKILICHSGGGAGIDTRMVNPEHCPPERFRVFPGGQIAIPEHLIPEDFDVTHISEELRKQSVNISSMTELSQKSFGEDEVFFMTLDRSKIIPASAVADPMADDLTNELASHGIALV